MRVSPSYIRSQGYNLQEYAATHNGQTSPPFSGTASILAWFGIYPRSEGERTLTASWQENDITTEVQRVWDHAAASARQGKARACNTGAITRSLMKYKLA